MESHLYLTHYMIQKRHWWFVTKTNIIMDTINRFCNLNRDARILDVGCGAGLMLDSLNSIGNIYGMDTADEAIKFCNEKFNGRIFRGSLPSKVPFENNSFKLITALDVIEHVEDDLGALKAMRDLLQFDGKIVLTVPACMSLWSAHDEVNQHKRRYNLAELRGKLESAGLEIEKISYFNTLLFPVVYIVRNLGRIANKPVYDDFSMPRSFVNSSLRILFGIEKYLLRHFNQPIGVSILAVVKKK